MNKKSKSKKYVYNKYVLKNSIAPLRLKLMKGRNIRRDNINIFIRGTSNPI
jgi:hypothetical protein